MNSGCGSRPRKSSDVALLGSWSFARGAGVSPSLEQTSGVETSRPVKSGPYRYSRNQQEVVVGRGCSLPGITPPVRSPKWCSCSRPTAYAHVQLLTSSPFTNRQRRSRNGAPSASSAPSTRGAVRVSLPTPKPRGDGGLGPGLLGSLPIPAGPLLFLALAAQRTASSRRFKMPLMVVLLIPSLAAIARCESPSSSARRNTSDARASESR